MVVELAVYEKEPRAVELQVKDYEHLGFDIDIPLYYALIAGETKSIITNNIIIVNIHTALHC
jgi:hypothetical protein